VALETAGLCEFTVNGVAVKRATIIGNRAAIVYLLTPRTILYGHDCGFLLSSNPERLSEIEWIVRRRATSIDPSAHDPSSPSHPDTADGGTDPGAAIANPDRSSVSRPLTLSCGELKVGVSTSGAVTIGVSREGLDASLTLGND
jgi:hypothetical protein